MQVKSVGKKFSYRIRLNYGYGKGTNPWNTAPLGHLIFQAEGDTYEECRRHARDQYYAHWKALGYDRAPGVRHIEVVSSVEVLA